MKYIKLSYINYFEIPMVEDVLKNNNIEYYLKESVCSAHGLEWGTGAGNFAPKILFVNSSKLDYAEAVLNKYL